jgi:hypothetical protein
VARNEIFISATPQEVFELLSDARTYSHWVVGSREIHAVDTDWPAVDAAFDHSVGRRPLVIRDHTSVAGVLSPVMLELRAKARPFGVARVLFHLQPEGNGTRVTMIEEPANRLLAVMIGPIGHGLIKLRNVETLRRLKDVGEGAIPRPGGRLATRQQLRGRAVER